MTKFLDGKLALVTGASRGIGAASAEAFARAGAHVILTARSADDLEAVEERIHAAGGSATIAPLDLTAADGIARLAAAVRERWETLDVLMLNAAMLGSLTPVQQIDGKELNRVFTLNLLAQQAMIAAFDPMLRKSAAGRLIAVTSSVARTPRAYWGAYGASKAALETLVLSYAQEVGNLTPIKAAIVDPGATATRMRALAYPGEDPATLKPPEAVAEALIALLRDDFETGYRLSVG
ncbi:SDR family NAD(P)-dependent oxidoreductase [Sphingosinicella ginsenosidimutans]|uniref:SDR family NAD(P)-dependent oxidoreductase n=1 Tax=Allosphingosinicella ginsenosidimutans TaxID=1176539 RepID=A0A5C6TX84_9SPHN|nr:SDR family NAD(P)-dependent oxidoreductase [Sphingosinicella ginsenosidimutans]TXC64515.1 SDR family NAD(P)-dependent oxidoreductase [Sphingosinicella ginsenosidimutans]